MSVELPETRYAETVDGVHIAYQVVGGGPFDLVYVVGWTSNLEAMWDMPLHGPFLRRLASIATGCVRSCGSLKQPAHLPMNFTMDESRYRNAVTIRPRHPRSIRGIGNAVIALLAAQVLALLFEAVAVLGEMSLLQRIIDGSPVTLTEATASDNRVAVAARLWLVLLVVTIVLWLIWQHRAHANLEALGAFGLEYSPRWAVGWWLIPIANWWKPYQVNRELWKASGGVNDRLSLLTWPVLGWWWASWILAGVLHRVVAAARNGADTPMELRSADILDLVLIAEVIASAVLAILVVRSVVARQDRLASAVPHLPKPPAPVTPRPDRSA